MFALKPLGFRQLCHFLEMELKGLNTSTGCIITQVGHFNPYTTE